MNLDYLLFDIKRTLRNRRVLALDKKLHGEKHPHVADDLINLAAVQFERGRYPEAEGYQREAVKIFRDWYGPDHPETASALTHLGRKANAPEVEVGP